MRALDTEESTLLQRLRSALALFESPMLRQFADLCAHLEAMQACDECGVWFDGMADSNICHRCEDDIRREEAAERRYQ